MKMSPLILSTYQWKSCSGFLTHTTFENVCFFNQHMPLNSVLTAFVYAGLPPKVLIDISKFISWFFSFFGCSFKLHMTLRPHGGFSSLSFLARLNFFFFFFSAY